MKMTHLINLITGIFKKIENDSFIEKKLKKNYILKKLLKLRKLKIYLNFLNRNEKEYIN